MEYTIHFGIASIAFDINGFGNKIASSLNDTMPFGEVTRESERDSANTIFLK